MLAEAAAEAPSLTAPAPGLGVSRPRQLLESIHVKESLADDAEVFANVWAPGGYPNRSFAASLVIFTLAWSV